MRRLAPVIGMLVLVSTLLGACQPKPAWEECIPNHPLACTVVDGVALGVFMVSIPPDGRPCAGECDDPLGTARAALGPDHALINGIDSFMPDMRAVCRGDPCAFSGIAVIYVFRFAGDAVVPVFVRCPGIGPSCRAIAVGTVWS